MEKSKEEILAERKAKKLAKQQGKGKKTTSSESAMKPAAEPIKVPEKVAEVVKPAEPRPKPEGLVNGEAKAPASDKPRTAPEKSEKPTLTKAERRAIQEQQRAAKAAAKSGCEAPKETATKTQTQDKQQVTKSSVGDTRKDVNEKKSVTKRDEKALVLRKARSKSPMHQVRLVSHLYVGEVANIDINSTQYHPSIVKFNSKYDSLADGGSNTRCIAFLAAVKDVIKDYVTPPCKDFARGIEGVLQYSIAYLQRTRTLDVSILNAVKFIKSVITQLDAKSLEKEEKEKLIDAIDTYKRDQIDKAGQAIKMRLLAKITNNDVILTYGNSDLIGQILEEAYSRKMKFRVIIVDSRPFHEGRRMLERLTASGIKCTSVLINAVSFIMPEVTKIFICSHALLANGYLMARAGTAQIALMGKCFNVPVLACCETHKFSERVQTDAFVFNEIGNPNSLILNSDEIGSCSDLAAWQSIPELTPLNLVYDVTPPNLVTAVITEIAILPCTSVPVILRIKPSEMCY